MILAWLCRLILSFQNVHKLKLRILYVGLRIHQLKEI